MNNQTIMLDTKYQKALFRIGAISILYNSLMLFYTLVSQVLVIAVSLLFGIYIVFILSKVFKFPEMLFMCSIIFLPVSTVSILGTSYASLPLTWHNISIILLVMYILMYEKFSVKYFVPITLFVIYSVIVSIFVPYFVDAIKQILTITLFLLTFIIGERNKQTANQFIVSFGWQLYLIAVLSVAIQIILQKLYVDTTGQVVGLYAPMGAGRRAYAGLMGDYSFASLFIISGNLYVFLQYVSYRKIGLIKFIFYEGFLFVSAIITSARTGIVAFAIIIILFYLFNIKKLSPRSVLVLFMGGLAIPYVISKIMSGRGGQSLFESSGRISSYIKTLELIGNNMFFGYGFGLRNLRKLCNIGVPHNFFLQYLVQSGIIGMMLIAWCLIIFVKENMNKTSGDMKWIFWLIAIGSMLVPDIFSSRYLYVIVTLLMMSPKYCNSKDILCD